MIESELQTALAAVRAAQRDEAKEFEQHQQSHKEVESVEQELHQRVHEYRHKTNPVASGLAYSPIRTEEALEAAMQMFKVELPARRKQANDRFAEALLKLDAKRRDAVEAGNKFGQSILDAELRRISEAIRPAIAPLLIEGAEPDLSDLVQFTARGKLVYEFKARVAAEAKDYEPNFLCRARCMEEHHFRKWEFEHLHRQTQKLASQALASLAMLLEEPKTNTAA